MSRSYQRHKISFGRAAAGCSQRSKKTNTDWANEKARQIIFLKLLLIILKILKTLLFLDLVETNL